MCMWLNYVLRIKGSYLTYVFFLSFPSGTSFLSPLYFGGIREKGINNVQSP